MSVILRTGDELQWKKKIIISSRVMSKKSSSHSMHILSDPLQRNLLKLINTLQKRISYLN